MKIRPVRTESFYMDRWTDGQTDVNEANGRFSQFCEKRLLTFKITL